MKTTQQNISNLKLIILMGVAQFLDILDFMIIMPLGPDYASALGINLSQLGYSAVAYTISAAISGLLSSIFIDRFERKRVLLIAVSGLICANLIAAFSQSYEQFLLARLIAGIFGGPSTAIVFAIITDLVPEKTRGYVIGKVMTAFSFAATFGVPLCLQISLIFGWKMVFFAIAFVGLVVIILNSIYLPKMTLHLNSKNDVRKVTYKSLFNSKINIVTFSFASLGFFASFLIIPYISAYLQFNLNYPRAGIGPLYFVGGIFSFVTVQVIGRFVDKYKSSNITFLANIFLMFTLFFGFTYYIPSIPIFVVYVPFLIGMSMRIVSNSTLVSKVPPIHERAGFMSIVSMFQHIFSALGSFAASLILVQPHPSAAFQNMWMVSSLAIAIYFIIPFIMKYVEKCLKLRVL